MLGRIISIVLALLVTMTSFVVLSVAERRFVTAFLVFGFGLFVAAICCLHARRDVPAWIFFVGSFGLLGWSLYDRLIPYGLDHHWFGIGLLEHPITRRVVWVFQVATLFTFVGILWLSARFINTHLTMRWSQRRPTS